MGIKQWFKNLMAKLGIRRVKKKSPILKALLENPENMKMEAYIEGDEIIVKIRKRDKKELL